MLTTILKDYQRYNPESGKFDRPRTLREYARVLGVNHATLSMIFQGKREPGGFVIRALFDTFPSSAQAFATAIAVPEREPEAVTA